MVMVLFPVNHAVHALQNILIPVLHVGDEAVGAVLEPPLDLKVSAALQQIERTPAEEA